MAWLQSSFTSHQLFTESGGSNTRKGYKSGASSKNTDPDKSDTPLLHDNTPLLSPENESNASNWFESSGTASPKKQNLLQNISGKPSFLSSGFFNRSGSKIKAQANPLDSSKSECGNAAKPKWDEMILSKVEKPKSPVAEDYHNDSDDSEEDLYITRNYYRRIKSDAD